MANKYSYVRDAKKKLSEHFTVGEFKCRDGTDEILIADELVQLLEQIRAYFGAPIHINSAYRTAAYNAKINGAKKSQHVQGTAADITVEGVPVKAVAGFADRLNATGGVGMYPTFVHVDARGYKSRWDNTSGKQVVVSGFGITEGYFSQWKAKGGEQDLNEADVVRIIERELAKKFSDLSEPSEWAVKELEEAKAKGITDGSRPKAPATREEVAIMVKRSLEVK